MNMHINLQYEANEKQFGQVVPRNDNYEFFSYTWNHA